MFKQCWIEILLFSACSLDVCLPSSLLAQIVPDDTLGNEGSIVTPDVTIREKTADLVEGGAIRDNNLFHSFSDFNVGDGNNVYFANPEGVANIITRITGNNISQIFGTLGVDGAANLFLLNPNGIIFGENASLDINGSFLATTAESYIFDNDLAYSATNPETPPLLTINIPIGLQMGNSPREIMVEGTGHNLSLDPITFAPIRNNRSVGLTVGNSNTLALIGGGINFSGGNLTAAAGNIEIGSIATGDVKIISTEDSFTFDYQNINDFKDINLTQAASLEVSGDRSGNIRLQGRNINLLDTSAIVANTLGITDGGKVELNATDSVTIVGTDEGIFPSAIFHQVETGATGNSDKLIINTDILQIDNNAFVSSGVAGTGNSGNLEIFANRIEISNTSPTALFATGLFAQVLEGGTGKGGNIEIVTQNLNISENSVISTSSLASGESGNIDLTADFVRLARGGAITSDTVGEGNAGDINLNISGSLEIDGQSSFLPSSISSFTIGIDREGNTASERNNGNGGEINITAGSVALTNGGVILGNTASGGDAGNISLLVSGNLLVDGQNSFGGSSGVGSQVGILDTLGNVVSGRGNGGKIKIAADSIALSNGGIISASTFGEGDAGNIDLLVSGNLLIDGQSSVGGSSGVVSQVGVLDTVGNIISGRGNGGEIKITADSIALSNGGVISTNTAGEGNAGNIKLYVANSLKIDNQNLLLGGISSEVGVIDVSGNAVSGRGNGGNIEIVADLVELNNSGVISASTGGEGNAGNIELKVEDALYLNNNSAIASSSQINALGNGGDVRIETNLLELTDAQITATSLSDFNAGSVLLDVEHLNLFNNAEVSVSGLATGNAGNLIVDARQVNLTSGSSLQVQVANGQQGNINLSTENIFLENSQINAQAIDSATGGNISIENTDNLVLRENSQIIARAVTGNGGNILITTTGLFQSFDSNISASSQFGLDGNVELTIFNNDPIRGLEKLPITLSDRESQITAGCPTQEEANFIVTGKGGLPEDPSQQLTESVYSSILELPSVNSSRQFDRDRLKQQTRVDRPIVEALSWQINDRGNVELISGTSIPNNQNNRVYCDRIR